MSDVSVGSPVPKKPRAPRNSSQGSKRGTSKSPSFLRRSGKSSGIFLLGACLSALLAWSAPETLVPLVRGMCVLTNGPLTPLPPPHASKSPGPVLRGGERGSLPRPRPSSPPQPLPTPTPGYRRFVNPRTQASSGRPRRDRNPRRKSKDDWWKWTKTLEAVYSLRDANRDADWRANYDFRLCSDGVVRSRAEISAYLKQKYDRISRYRERAGQPPLDRTKSEVARTQGMVHAIYEEIIGRPWVNIAIEPDRHGWFE